MKALEQYQFPFAVRLFRSLRGTQEQFPPKCFKNLF